MKRVVVVTSMASLQERICRCMFEDTVPVRSNGGLSGIWRNCQVLVILTARGKVNVAVTVADAIREAGPDAVIVAGTARSLTSGLLPGNIVVGSHFCYHDVSYGIPSEYGRYPNEPQYYFSDDGIVSRMIDVGLSFHQGLVLTGDKVIDSRSVAKKICNRFYKARVVDMESAVVAQICHRNEVPFVSVRVIDDVPVMEEKAKNLYDQFRHPLDENALADKVFSVLNKTMESL